jgi:hypothetical protein
MKLDNLGIIGGCGSSGTTLFVHLLSRNPKICSGPEFNCFNHPELYDYETFARAYRTMFEDRCPPHGYVDVYVFMTQRDHYGIDDETLRSWVDACRDTPSLLGAIAGHMCRRFEARQFVEKTPTNVYCFENIAKVTPDVPLIHLVRDGRDVAVSLMNRDFNLFGAGSRWLFDTLAGLRARGHDRYLELRYEELVRDPDRTLSTAFAHLGVPIEPEILETWSEDAPGVYTENWKDRKEPRSWSKTPADPISTSSVGRYKTSLSSEQLSMLYRIQLTGRAADRLGVEPMTFGELLEDLGYGQKNHRPTTTRGWGAWAREASIELKDYLRRLNRLVSKRSKRIPVRYTRVASLP